MAVPIIQTPTGSRRRLPLADGIAHVENVYISLDSKGDIDSRALKTAFKELEIPIRKKDIEHLLARAGGSKLSKREFLLYCLLKEFELRQIYDAVDEDGTGRINFKEFSTGMYKLGWQVNETTIRQVFKDLDGLEDESPGLTYLEWRSLAVHTPGVLRSLADNFHDNRMEQFDIGGFNVCVNKSRDLSALINLAAGFLAGSFSRTLTAPAERIKTELQVAVGKPPSIASLCRRLLREDGMRAFFQGNLANCLKVAPQSALFFYLMDVFKKVFPTMGSPLNADMHSFICGASAGITSQFIIYPLEPIKTCLTVAPRGRYSGIADCGRKLICQRGWSALYSGAMPTMLGCIPYSGVQFFVYDSLQREYLQRYHGQQIPFRITFLCGLLSSTIGMTASYPLVVVRTRLQIQGSSPDKPMLYSGVLDCIRKTWVQDGSRGLMRGVTPNLLKAAPAAAVNLAIYEQAKNWLLSVSSSVTF
jgi:solute carrier family 25 phosphate transporter 23/24/25/41